MSYGAVLNTTSGGEVDIISAQLLLMGNITLSANQSITINLPEPYAEGEMGIMPSYFNRNISCIASGTNLTFTNLTSQVATGSYIVVGY